MKVSIITACKNRTQALYASIGTWLLKKEVHEVIIVDWSSDNPIFEITNLDDRVKVIRVDNEKYFNMPQPLNLAASIATGDAILTMGTDYFFNPYDDYNFFERYSIDDTSFVCGLFDYQSDPHTLYGPLFYYLRGLMYVSRKNFLESGGYRETNSKYYGNEDDELIDRLEKSGLEKKMIDQGWTIFHLPHTDKKRIENFEAYHTDEKLNQQVYDELSKSYSGDELKWQSEYTIVQRHTVQSHQSLFTGEDNKTKWEIDKFTDQLYKAKKV